MASVWVARERSASSGAQRLVAVKAMLPELAQHSAFRSMFLGEVQIIQSINHGHVVRVFDVSEDSGMLYMAMEWVEGDSLRNIIRAAKSRGALPPEIAVRIAQDAAAGLHAAHELRDWSGELRGIVHCDVSPHNILVGMDGKAKLVDFGIANALGRIESSNDGERIKGKLSYMSPEQARGDRLDRRTDIFALGIVLFEMTTGEQLFKGRDPAHTLELVRHGTIPRPSHLNPRYPERLEQLVLRALDREPDRRYQTAAEFEEALATYLYEERISVSHAAVAQLLHRVIGSRIEKRRDVLATVIAAVDEQGPPVLGVERPSLSSIVDTTPFASDPFNSVPVNTGDESGLGIAARLESHTVASLPISSHPPAPRAFPWLWIALLGAGLVLGAVLTTVLVLRDRPTSKVQYVTANQPRSAPRAGASSGAETTAVSAAASQERVVSPDSLPLADTERTARGAIVARPKGGKSGKQDEAETAETTPEAKPELEAPAEEAAKPPQSAGDQQMEATSDKPAAAAGINRAAANTALAAAAAAARACRSLGESPTGTGRAAVTFASDGSVAAVSISQQFVGTAIGSCVLSHFRNARAPAFSGDPTTLFCPFQIPQ
jgi:eukaryotic-like serine/threonine-protein kinase